MEKNDKNIIKHYIEFAIKLNLKLDSFFIREKFQLNYTYMLISKILIINKVKIMAFY